MHPTRDRPARRVAASCVGLLAAVVVLVMSSTASASAGPAVSSVQTDLLRAHDVPGFAVTEDHAVALGGLLNVRGSYADTLVDSALRSAHQRGFLAFDRGTTVRLRAVEFIGSVFAASYPTSEGPSWTPRCRHPAGASRCRRTGRMRPS